MLVRFPPPNLPPCLEAAAIATYQELLILYAPPHHPSPTASTTPSEPSHVPTVDRRFTNDSNPTPVSASVLVSTRRARGTWNRAASSSRASRERNSPDTLRRAAIRVRLVRYGGGVAWVTAGVMVVALALRVVLESRRRL